MTRWGDKHNKAIKSLFDSDDYNATRQDNSYIESVWDSLPGTNYLKANTSEDRFRHHWKEKSQLYMAESALSGTRRKTLEASESSVAKKDAEEEEEEEEEVLDQKVEYSDPSPKPEVKMSKKPVPKATTVAKFQTDEKQWIPVHSMHRYQLGEYDRIAVTIDAPINFTGKKNTYKLYVDGLVLIFKVPIDVVHTDPHHVHSLLCTEFGRTFSADSVKELNWKNTTRAGFEDDKGNPKFATFRLALPFPCEKDFADDLEHPGVVFRTISHSDGSKARILYVELKSTYKLVAESKEEGDLEVKEFVSPVKSTASKKSPTGHAAALLEALFAQGMSLDAVKRAISGSDDSDDMDIDGAYDLFKKRKQGA